MIWFAVILGLGAGFALGRARLDGVVDWSEDWTAPGWRTWRFWLAAPVGLACLALVWIVRPRRTLANVRSWRAGERLHPAPEYDPQWAQRRPASEGGEQ
ncbi:hypothetical protein [Streptomyces sp. NPDC095613]|uniref:hypothetical protein n=1 Tax=Streptomyces sp. NPDC095613 TaxID=3155540 RepID=UPI003325D1CE